MLDKEKRRVKPKIVTFWHGAALHPVYRMCIESQVRCGFDVTMYSYAPVANLPDGVRNNDAAPILPLDIIERLRCPRAGENQHENRHILLLSDLFRMRLQRLGLGLWLDTDIFVLREFDIDPDQPFFGYESRRYVGNAVLYLPSDSPVLDDVETLLATPDLIPDWLTLRLRIRKAWWDLTRTPYMPGNLSALVFGPLAATRLLKRHRLIGRAFPEETFYLDDALFFDPMDIEPILANPRILGIHVKDKRRSDLPPAPGSLYAWAQRIARS